MPFDKVRTRFCKDGDLRFVSHHDLMRAFERMLRRSQLPFRSTEGFHPQPRVIFAQSLSLGLVGRQEVVEIEWTEPVEPVAAFEQLNRQSPAGLTFLSANRIEMKRSAKPCRAVYSMHIPAAEMETLQAAVSRVSASAELWVERERPHPREINIRSYVKELRCVDDRLEMDVWITPNGSARADEIVRALGLNHLLENGAVIERAVLEIEDELDPMLLAARPVMPTREERQALERPISQSPKSAPSPVATAHSAHWGASPSGPIVE